MRSRRSTHHVSFGRGKKKKKKGRLGDNAVDRVPHGRSGQKKNSKRGPPRPPWQKSRHGTARTLSGSSSQSRKKEKGSKKVRAVRCPSGVFGRKRKAFYITLLPTAGWRTREEKGKRKKITKNAPTPERVSGTPSRMRFKGKKKNASPSTETKPCSKESQGGSDAAPAGKKYYRLGRQMVKDER